MAEWLEQASHWHDVLAYCHDLDVMGLNNDQVQLGECSSSV